MRVRVFIMVALLTLVATAEISQAAGKSLQVWIMQAGDAVQAQKVIDRVNREFSRSHPGVTVRITWIPWASGQQKFITAIIGNMTPDVAEVGTTWNPDFIAMGALENLNPYLKKWGQQGDLNPSLLEAATSNGKIYGVPWYAGNRAVYYRKDWFAAAGIKDFPTSWAGFAEVARKLTQDTNGDGKIDRYGFSVNGASQHEFLPLIWMNQGEVAVKTKQGWRAAIDSPQSREALQWFADLYLKEKVSPSGSITWNALSSRKAFETGSQAMMIDVAALVPKYLADPHLKDKFAIAPLPYSKQPAGFIGGSNLVMFSQSPKKKLAWDYIQLMMSAKHQMAWAGAVKFFPGRMSLLQSDRYTKDPYLSVFASGMKYGKVYPPVSQWGQIENSKLLVEMMQEIMMKKKTVKAATAAAAREMNEIFRNQ